MNKKEALTPLPSLTERKSSQARHQVPLPKNQTKPDTSQKGKHPGMQTQNEKRKRTREKITSGCF